MSHIGIDLHRAAVAIAPIEGSGRVIEPARGGRPPAHRHGAPPESDRHATPNK